MLIIYFLLIVRFTFGFDFAETVLQNIDQNVSPCEDFYRHACPLGSPASLIGTVLQNVTNQVITDGAFTTVQQLQLIRDITTPSEITTDAVYQILPNIYDSICKAGGNTTALLQMFEIALGIPENCGSLCLRQLSSDPDCKRVTKYISEAFDGMAISNLIITNIGNILKTISSDLENVMGIDYFLVDDVELGIQQTREMINELKSIAHELIENTPWALNHNVTELISHVTSSIMLYENRTILLNETMTRLQNLNEKYTECKGVVQDISELNQLIFCVAYTAQSPSAQSYVSPYYLYNNAMNIHPKIGVGFVWFYIMRHTDNYAAKIGSPGFVIAHELSHSIIKSKNYDLLTYFSSQSMKCIQDQYASSCKEYKEISCFVNDKTFEENGADVLALQMVQVLLERHFGEKASEKVSIYTPEQLLYYSVALTFCTGDRTTQRLKSGMQDAHSPRNIRVNAMVNHESFQTAFNCPNDSRMMKSKTKSCHVYGKDAPANKRFQSLL